MTALDNRHRKARALAPALYRRGLAVADLLALPYSSRDRSVATVTRFARQAYAEAGVEETPPHGPGSETWLLTADLLAWMVQHPDDERVPPVDLADDRARWILLTEEVTEDVPAVTEDVAALIEDEPCSDEESLSCVSTVDMTSLTTSTTDAASPTSIPVASPTGTRRGVATPAPVVGDWPSDETGTCAGCGARHRRYGPKGGGALCPSCRAVALGTAS